MSFRLPPLKAKTPLAEEFGMNSGTYGVPDPMILGMPAAAQKLGTSHPLEASEKNFHQNKLKRDLVMLRNTQGLHAPLRIAMEIKATEKVGRHPFLPSSGLMRDVLLGRDEDIGFEDVFNTSEFREQMGQPHAIVERSLNLL
ncbi:proteasome maturation protein [Diachasmimorpha longicaudata]|uniref:proteasome maturation protein n=1 Tax=Diachasmimorpha longicaudata TaxID=58733 RepID=UPI0030B8F616